MEIDLNGIKLKGDLSIPPHATGVVLFAHGSGSSRLSPRNQYVARVLQEGGIGTLLIDLLTLEEERIDEVTRELRFNIPLLAERLIGITDWLLKNKLKIGYFGASTGAAAALVAAAHRPKQVFAVVSRGGRPDLAREALARVRAPTLLIVGGDDVGVIELNEIALEQLVCVKQLVLIPGATHLFEEEGTLAQVARQALAWFIVHNA